jgi:hypothetical protein
MTALAVMPISVSALPSLRSIAEPPKFATDEKHLGTIVGVAA